MRISSAWSKAVTMPSVSARSDRVLPAREPTLRRTGACLCPFLRDAEIGEGGAQPLQRLGEHRTALALAFDGEVAVESGIVEQNFRYSIDGG